MKPHPSSAEPGARTRAKTATFRCLIGVTACLWLGACVNVLDSTTPDADDAGLHDEVTINRTDTSGADADGGREATSFCGDGACANDESAASCPEDCRTSCGDGECSGDESDESCPEDCGTSCGDGECNGDESDESCPEDCGTSCGDGECSGDESDESCPEDCQIDPPVCGDGTCDAEEGSVSCPEDCGTNCGDGACNGDESDESCPEDCQVYDAAEVELCMAALCGDALETCAAPPPIASDFSNVVWIHDNISHWPQTVTLEASKGPGDTINISNNGTTCGAGDACWPNFNPSYVAPGDRLYNVFVGGVWIFVYRDEAWIAGLFDSIIRDQQVVWDHNLHPGSRWPGGLLSDFQPQPCERYGWMISTALPVLSTLYTVDERSNVSEFAWPAGSGSGVPGPDGEVRGHIDSVSDSGTVSGWACYTGWSGSIDVHVYVGGAAGDGGINVAALTANEASEPAVAEICESSGTAHRFHASIHADDVAAHHGQPVFVHGISPVENGNNLLDGSGIHTVP